MSEMVLRCPHCNFRTGFKFVAEDSVAVPLDTRDTWAIAPEGVNFEKMKLVNRINALAKQSEITPSMADLAHLIRLEGNDATHDEEEEFTAEEAHQMQSFTELFLIYTITLPKRVEQAKAKAKGSGGDAPSSL